MNTNFIKISFIMVLALCLRNLGHSQVKLTIDSVSISYVVDSLKSTIDENLCHGPYLSGNITIQNEGKEVIVLNYSDVWNNSYYQFLVNNKIYNKRILHLFYFRNDLIIIPSGGKYSIGAGAWLFLGTDLDKKVGSEYNGEVIEALPTLQFVLQYGGETYKSCGIKKVIYVPRDDE